MMLRAKRLEGERDVHQASYPRPQLRREGWESLNGTWDFALDAAAMVLEDADANILDRVSSYTALRTIEVCDGRYELNGLPYFMRLVLDQGYWPETGMTAPSDDAFREDIRLCKRMGFNGVRKHQKIEAERYLYWADVMGFLVWEKLPSAYAFSTRCVGKLIDVWRSAIERDRNHPSIVTWATGNDGWEIAETVLIGVHDYEGNPEVLRNRFDSTARGWQATLEPLQSCGRKVLFKGRYQGQPVMLSEFGGISLAGNGVGWGYSTATSPGNLEKRYARLLRKKRAIPELAGFCYTQLTDTYQEANGLLTMERKPKVPLASICLATRGAANSDEQIQEDELCRIPSPAAPNQGRESTGSSGEDGQNGVKKAGREVPGQVQ